MDTIVHKLLHKWSQELWQFDPFDSIRTIIINEVTDRERGNLTDTLFNGISCIIMDQDYPVDRFYLNYETYISLPPSPHLFDFSIDFLFMMLFRDFNGTNFIGNWCGIDVYIDNDVPYNEITVCSEKRFGIWAHCSFTRYPLQWKLIELLKNDA